MGFSKLKKGFVLVHRMFDGNIVSRFVSVTQ